MEYAYLASNAISMSIWLALFWLRKDLRKPMLVMSLLATPLAFFDLIYVPSYWQPITSFDAPIGAEGFIYSFSIGGIAAAVYAELAHRTFRRIAHWQGNPWRALLIPLLMLTLFVLACVCGVPNPQIAAYIAVGGGILGTLALRKDLAASALVGALAFGVIYFVSLKLWVTLFPAAQDWFVFDGMPKLFIWGVPGWEALFGIFFGGLWSNMYELTFGYRLAPAKAKRH